MEACKKILITGLESLDLPLDKDKIEQLMCFIKLLEKWNKAYNLTSIRNTEDMVRLHLLDSLAIIPFIEGKHVIDIGTGTDDFSITMQRELNLYNSEIFDLVWSKLHD